MHTSTLCKLHLKIFFSVSRPTYMSLPSPNMPTAEDEDETDGNTEVYILVHYNGQIYCFKNIRNL